MLVVSDQPLGPYSGSEDSLMNYLASFHDGKFLIGSSVEFGGG